MTRFRQLSSLATVLLAAVGATLAFAPGASAGGGQRLVPKAEAWYEIDPLCSLPTGCLRPLFELLPLATVTTASTPGTLQVSADVGLETARSYLALPFARLSDQPLRGAALTIPLDTALADGSIAPQMAKIEVCLATAVIRPAAGSTKLPPGVNCNPHAELTYRAAPSPHLVGDLKPLLAYLTNARGLALLPDLHGAGLTDTWRVVFSAQDRKGKGHPPAASVAVTTDSTADSSSPPGTSSSTGPGSTGTATVPLPDVGLPPPADETTPLPVDTSPPVLAASPRLITTGFAYPGVLLLPLILGGLGLLTLRLLATDLTPKKAADQDANGAGTATRRRM